MQSHALCRAAKDGWTVAVCLFAAVLSLASARPGLDSPQAVGPFLNGRFPADEPTSSSEWTVRETYTGINIGLPMHLTPYPGTNLLLCVAKEGRVFLFEDDPAVTTTTTFLDLRSQTFTSSDCGMTWLVFHPRFGVPGDPDRGHVYITYKWAPASGGNGSEAYWRLSRFTVPDGTLAADPTSELVMIQQFDRQQFHDSGCMMFGPDGYLYVAVGDEGGANDQFDVAQKIDDRLFSGILRIDVDRRAGNHAIRRQPAPIAMPAGWPASFTAHYSIPADNPFVDAGGGNLEEFYAIGLRQPYRFSYDADSSTTWIAESGQDTSEELCLLSPGANYGWPFREGGVAGPKAEPAVVHGTLTSPVWDALHSAGPDGCQVGGFVYRGQAHPGLSGKYLTVDNVSGRIRAFTRDGAVATAEHLTDMPSGSVYSGTSTIGRDTDGEPVFVKINGTGARGRFMKLALVPPAVTNPVWYRFEDRDRTNTTGHVAANPGHATADTIADGLPMVAWDDGNTSANVLYDLPNGLVPAGAAENTAGVRITGTPGDGGYPGNANGDLYTSDRFGRFDDFTIELSFKPAPGSLDSGYQCFLGLDGGTGVVPQGGEYGPPIQPFRLMRWGRTDAEANPGVPLQNGDLFLNVRTADPATGVWRSAAIEVIDRDDFTGDRWYHLAIVGRVEDGTLSVYSHESGAYVLRGQATGYAGNLQPGVWSLGRGMFGGNFADWVKDTTFDEVRFANVALEPTGFLYANQPWQPTVVVSNPPELLSKTGAFADLATLTPAAGVVPYTVNSPLWSDAAEKLRWIVLPNDGTHDAPAEKISFDPEGPWTFPPGTVFIKHFELATDEGNPTVRRRLETRFILIPESGEPWGVTYRWREDGSDAELLPGGMVEDIPIHGADGGTRIQPWTYPSPTDCRVCHNSNAGHVLGVQTWQLNGDLTYPLTGRTANQLETLGSLGWFDGAYRPEHLRWMLKSHAIDDESAPLELRVRSYLDSNCAQCHRPDGVRALFDARFTTPIERQALIRGHLVEPAPVERIIVPRDPEHSMLRTRHASTGPLKMPPLAKSLVDEEAAAVIERWILSLADSPGVELVAPSSASGPFVVDVRFSSAVTGLDASDFVINGGSATALTGSGADYLLAIAPTGYKPVTIKLPADSAGGNFASTTVTVPMHDPGLLAWLKLDETAGTAVLDSSPQENHGALVDMEPEDRITGKFGNALNFDQSDERVLLPNVATGDFTISFWMRSTRMFPGTDNPPSGLAIVSADSPGARNDFLISGTRIGNTDRISFQTGNANGSPNMPLHAAGEVTNGDWVHVACTRSQGTGEMKIYIGGQLEATRTGSLDRLNANPVLSIGGNPEGSAVSYEGDLDQIRVFGRTLAAGEIADLALETDGLPPYEQWLASHMPGLSSLHDGASDPEGDGRTNFAEFAFGGDPLSPDRAPVLVETGPGGATRLAFHIRRARTGATYRIETASGLGKWADASSQITEISRVPIGDGEYELLTVDYTPDMDENRRFFRIVAAEAP